ncbi:hypothetical protein B4089_0408 [Bacillus licheniformis]|nr:hypothetical protein B4089_0408 [Bacillus licheniformis]
MIFLRKVTSLIQNIRFIGIREFWLAILNWNTIPGFRLLSLF